MLFEETKCPSQILLIIIGEAVFARCLSSLKSERAEASKHLKGPKVTKYKGCKKEFIEHIRKVAFILTAYKIAHVIFPCISFMLNCRFLFLGSLCF